MSEEQNFNLLTLLDQTSDYRKKQSQTNEVINQAVKQNQFVNPNFIRSAGQGLYMGWGDELEARLRRISPTRLLGITDKDKSYRTIRNEIRRSLKEYEKQHPNTALTTEVVSGALPALVAIFSSPVTGGGGGVVGVGKLAKSVNTLKEGAKQVGAPLYNMRLAPTVGGKIKQIGGLSTVGALGYDDTDMFSRDFYQAGNFIDLLGDASASTAVGSGIVFGVPVIGRMFQGAVAKLNSKANDAVQKEFLRLVKQTGRTPEEVIALIHNGRIVADNKTLTAVIKSMVSEGGETADFILRTQKRLTNEAINIAKDKSQKALASDIDDDNIVRGARDMLKKEKEGVGTLYDEVFSANPAVDPSVADELMKILMRDRTALNELNRLGRLKGNNEPLIKLDDDGVPQFTREPSLEEAEIVRRIMSEKASGAYNKGKGTLGESYAGLEAGLRSKLDKLYPPLAGTRGDYKRFKNVEEAFQAGRKVFATNLDEMDVEILLDELTGEARKAFSLGVQEAVRRAMGKNRGSAQAMDDMGNADTKLGRIFRMVMPLTKEGDEAVSAMELAGTRSAINKAIPADAGSPTYQQTIAKAQRDNAGTTAVDLARSAQGDIFAISKIIGDNLRRKGFTEEDTQRLAQLLYSRNPEMVKKALTSTEALEQLQNQIDNVFTNTARILQRPAQQQASQYNFGEQ